jgi:hypothetical protein
MRFLRRWFSAPEILSAAPVGDVIAPGGTTLVAVEFNGWGWISVDWSARVGAAEPAATRFLGSPGTATLAVPVDLVASVRMRNLFGTTEQALRIAPTLASTPPEIHAARMVPAVPARPFPVLGGRSVASLRRSPMRAVVQSAEFSAQARIGRHRSRLFVPRVSRCAMAGHPDRPSDQALQATNARTESPHSHRLQDVPE